MSEPGPRRLLFGLPQPDQRTERELMKIRPRGGRRHLLRRYLTGTGQPVAGTEKENHDY